MTIIIIQKIPSVVKDMKKLELIYHVDWNVIFYKVQPVWKHSVVSQCF